MLVGKGGQRGEQLEVTVFLQSPSYHLFLPVLLPTSHHSPSQPFLLAANGLWGAQAAYVLSVSPAT